MSGDENTNNDPAQVSKINQSSVGCKDVLVEPSDNKELCYSDGVKSVPSSCFDLSSETIPVYPDGVVGDEGYGGDITNWDIGKCFDQDLNPVQTVGETFDIFDTSFQDSEQPEMGNTIGNNTADQQSDHGNVFSAEQLPACGGERMSCELVEDGSKGTHLSEKLPGNSLGGNDGDIVPNFRNETPGEKSLSSREVEKKTFEPAEVGSWESIFEVAKQSEEIVAQIPTVCDQHVLSHESEQVLNGVECIKSESLTPGDKVVEISTEDPGEDSSKNDHGKHNILIDLLRANNVVSDPTYVETMLDGVKFDEASKIQKENIGNAISEDGQDNACKKYIHVDEQVGKSHLDMGKHSCNEKASLNEQSRQSLKEVSAGGYVVVLGMPAANSTVKPHRTRTLVKVNDVSEKARRGRPRKASATTINKSSQQRSASSSRVLRSKSQECPITPEPIANLENTQDSYVVRRGRKKKEMKGKCADEFSKMRKRLRYLLHRISYEQNLLDAYSNEGWRGQSVEKLRPEKELQRAKADINRSKVKIRELFHRLDSMSVEGKFPDTLYDSDGLIDSEDIFCAKCGSKDLLAGNDIILCDGNCERGFHQYCLEPPLRTEEIPPGDEGWFCPACDCKFDCVDLLNDSHISQGAKLSIEDRWEKVFPEAVAATAGLNQDDLMGLPSDDSDDNDYNPDGQNDDFKDEERKASSDESDSNQSDSNESDSSDFSSASEDLGAVCKDEQYLGLPSDDSEDNDFDPDAKNANDDDKSASSSSDFSSASEDLGATIGKDEMSENEEPSLPVELHQDLGDSLPVSAKRNAERLDYKKLYDETYGNAVSDSSDDEEWTDGVATTKKKTSAKREVSVSANGDASASADGTFPKSTSRRRGQPKRDHQVETSSPVEPQKTPQETSSGGKSRKRPPYNKLPESITQRLYESFKENHYPDRSTKEKLTKELGLTHGRVDKWFGNARWSFHHHPSRVEASIARVVPGGSTPQTVAGSGVESNSPKNNIIVPDNCGADSSKSDKGISGEMISSPRKTRKRKEEEGELKTSKVDIDTSKETDIQSHSSKEATKAELSEAPEALGRGQRKRRKSGA